MTRKITLFVLLTLLAALLAAALVYTRPMRLQDIARLTPDACTGLVIDAKWNPYTDSGTEYMSLRLEPGDEGYDAFITLLFEQYYRRSLLSLIPINGTRTHRVVPGDAAWEIGIEAELPGISGQLVRLENFYGDLRLYDNARDRCYILSWRGREAYITSLFERMPSNSNTVFSNEPQ